MRTRGITLVEFDSQEFQTLQRVEPSIRIGFPTDEVDQMIRDGADKKTVNAWWARWEARKLQQVCKTRQEWDAKAIWEAWSALVTLIAVLDAQSKRDYWHRALSVSVPTGAPRSEVSSAAADTVQRAGWGLIAPGTDICGALAETRGAQLRDAEAALPLLVAARKAVGPMPEPHTSIKYEEV